MEVMAETILSTVTEGILGKLAFCAAQEIGLVLGVESELKELQSTLSAINAVLLDAEKQQSKKRAVRDWIEKLKDVVYDIDDVLDDFATEVLRKNKETRRRMLKEVRNFCSRSNPILYRRRMGHKIKELRERLQKISSDRRDLQLSEDVVEVQVQTRRVGTHSHVRESKVIGRDDDKNKIVQFIMSNRDHYDLLVYPIVGLGGLGKTTLAKLVYNDEKITQSYEIKMWVCASEDSTLNKVIERIIKSATGAHRDGLDLDQLQIHLREIINAKRFFLVLDDVWNDDSVWWTEIRDLLMGGTSGSTVLVTTRTKKVASIMSPISSYDLPGLPFDDCLSLFWKCVFNEGKEKNHPELLEIGTEIVRKCGRVPLAVITLGSLLYLKTDVHEWSYIRDSELWRLKQREGHILPALRVSYDYLPSHLKKCLAYCGTFPRNYEIFREDLVNRWMAQGLLQSPENHQQPEHIGNQYCEELLSRSFFQEIIYSFDSTPRYFKMHDLVVDLARSVAGAEFLEVDCGTQTVSDAGRHILFTEIDMSSQKFPLSLCCTKKVRSFSFAFQVGPISQSFVDTLVSSFIRLRELDLSGSEFEVLPRCINKLKHLRSLSLYGNRSIKTLPDSICKLLNLQTLLLWGCVQLQDLPSDIGKLFSLRYLFLTSQQICLQEKMLQALTSMHTLVFYMCNRLVSLSEGIRHLASLRVLRITKCSRLASFSSGLKNLNALEELVIKDCQELHLLESEDLQGLKCLRSLHLIKLPKMEALPRGLMQSSSALQVLDVRDCSRFTTLPDWLPSLSSLQVLYLVECRNLMSLPEGMQRLTRLQELSISGSPHLLERCEEGGKDWPMISHIPEIERHCYYYY